nr:uncharacterized protein LOC127325804 [Lolium perenne]
MLLSMHLAATTTTDTKSPCLRRAVVMVLRRAAVLLELRRRAFPSLPRVAASVRRTTSRRPERGGDVGEDSARPAAPAPPPSGARPPLRPCSSSPARARCSSPAIVLLFFRWYCSFFRINGNGCFYRQVLFRCYLDHGQKWNFLFLQA